MADIGYEIKGNFYPKRRYKVADNNYAVYDSFAKKNVYDDADDAMTFKNSEYPRTYFEYQREQAERLNTEYDHFIGQVCAYLGCKKKMVISDGTGWFNQ